MRTHWQTARKTGSLAAGLAWLALSGWAQERAGEAEIGFQQYSLTNGSQRVANAFGLTFGIREFIPRLGILSVSLAPAASDSRFRTGDSFVELKRFPWAGQYWTFRGGDFRLPGRLLDVPFSNLYYPDIAGRGAWIESTHGGRAIGFLFGAETLQAGVRVPLRLQTPQNMAGAYIRQRVGERLLLGARLLRLSNDLEKLRKTTYLAVPGDPLRSALTASLDALYTVAGPLKWYSEVSLSQGSREPQSRVDTGGPMSLTAGPLLETNRFAVRANYVYQTDSYLPLLGYYLGDRRGPFGEVKVRPFSRLEIYGSASEYSNNVARDPQRATFRSTAESGGFSLQLPSRFSLNGQWSGIELDTRKFDADPWEHATNEQVQLTLARSLGRHSVRVAVREFQQTGRAGLQRQRTAEVADTFQYRFFSLGAEVRAQRLIAAQDSKVSVFVRGNAQINLRRFSAYANIESGNDLANRTLFATSTTSSTVLGGTLLVTRDWDFNVEAFRNNLISELNPQNVFVLQGQGVYVPTVLAALNQWSLYFRTTKHLRWGKSIPPTITGLETYAIGQNPLKGSVEGFVMVDQLRGAEGIPVALDGGVTVLTDGNGRFRFESVGEGARKVGLALNELPADYDPGRNIETTVLVKPGKLSRADLDVIAVGYALQGTVVGPEGVSFADIVLRLLPTDRYTTPDNRGRFFFYNAREGRYEIALAEDTLPQYAVLKTPATAPIALGPAGNPQAVLFEFEVREPAKPVRQVTVAPRLVPIPQPEKPTSVPAPFAVHPPESQPVIAPVLPRPPPLPPRPEARPSPSTALQLYARGRELTQSGDFEAAVATLTEAIASNQTYALAFNSRGYALLRLLKYAQAVADFDQAIRLNPAYGNAYLNRAVAKRALGDVTGSKADLAKANALK